MSAPGPLSPSPAATRHGSYLAVSCGTLPKTGQIFRSWGTLAVITIRVTLRPNALAVQIEHELELLQLLDRQITLSKRGHTKNDAQALCERDPPGRNRVGSVLN